MLCLGSMSYGLIEAGTGASLRGAAFVLLALPLGALLVWRETRARHPVVPPRLFRDRRFVAANAMTVGSDVASLTGSLFLLPFLLIYTYGYSAAAAGAAFLPFSAIMAVGSRTAGGLALRIGSRAACRPRRCRRARIRVREHVGVSLAPVAVVEAYRRAMWTAAVLAVVAGLAAIACWAMILPSIAGRFEPCVH